MDSETRPDSSVLVACPEETRPCEREMMDVIICVDHGVEVVVASEEEVEAGARLPAVEDDAVPPWACTRRVVSRAARKLWRIILVVLAAGSVEVPDMSLTASDGRVASTVARGKTLWLKPG